MLNNESCVLRVGMEVQFVVLHHTGVDMPHFDLMIEVPGWEGLMTWRVMTGPETWGGGRDIGAVRIGDHRRAYLTYEGAISGGRGEVKRVAEGMLTIMDAGDQKMRVSVAGRAAEFMLDLMDRD